MTIASPTTQTSGSNTNGATTEFSFSFSVESYGGASVADQLEVIRETLATGVEETLTTGFTVTANEDQASSPGGVVEFDDAPSSGYRIWVRLNPSFVQATDLQSQGGFNMEVVEDQWDHQQRQINWLRDQVRKAPRVGVQGGTAFNGAISGDVAPGAWPVVKDDLTGFQWATNAGDATTVTASDSNQERTLAARFAEVANVKDFGAAGDGVTDDTAAIQAAIDTGKTVYFPDGDYLATTGDLTCDNGGQVFCGARAGLIETGYGGARILTADTSGNLFAVTAHGVSFFDLAFQHTGTFVDNAAIYAAKATNTDDIDVTVINCHFRNFTTAINVVGRALTAESNTFVGGTGAEVAIKRSWPASGTVTGTWQDLPYGFRKDRIVGNLCHGLSTFVQIDGADRIYYRGYLANNVLDIGGRLFQGAAADLICANNYVKHSTTTIIYMDEACESVQIVGNKFRGTPADTDNSPSYAVWFVDTIDGLVCANNDIGDLDGTGIRFDDAATNISISNNLFQNYGIDASGTDAAILVSSGVTLSRFAILGNIFKEGAGSDMPVYANGATLTNGKVRGNIWDLAKGAFVQGTYTNGGDLDIADLATGQWRVLAKSGVASSHTGSTAETTLATIAIPAGEIGPNGVFRLTTLWQATENANAKTIRSKLGSTTFHSVGLANQETAQIQRTVWNRNNAASQIAWVEATANSFTASTSSNDTMSENTAAALNLTITGELATGTDTITLDGYVLEVCYGR